MIIRSGFDGRGLLTAHLLARGATQEVRQSRIRLVNWSNLVSTSTKLRPVPFQRESTTKLSPLWVPISSHWVL